MKRCPQCQRAYDDSWKVCLHDKSELVDAAAETALPGGEASKPAEEKWRGVWTRPISGEKAEMAIGQYFLSRIGILSLVLGIAFFIAYSFQFIGAWGKIAAGFAAAGALLGLGKRIEKNPSMQWYGFALIGGGWATAYFVTYAMYHVAAVKVLFDPNLGLLSLVLATSLMMVDMLRYRSQAITVVVYLLGFITAGIGSLSTYSLIYAALLTMSMLMVINRMKWNRLMLIALPASYVTHLYWLGPEITHAEFYLSAGFLSLYGLLYSLSPMLVRSESEEDRKIQTTVTLINTTAYAWLMFRELDQFAGIWKFYFCLGLGLLHALAALLAKHGAKRSHLVTAHVTLALSFITLSFPLKYSDRWVEMAWLSEIPLLIFLGMYFKRLVYRVFAWGLGFVMSLHIVHSYSIIEPAARVLAFQWSDRMIVAAVAVVAFILAQTIYLWRRKDDALIEGEPAVGRGFLTVSVLFIGFLTMIDIHPYQMSIAWAVCAAMYFVPGFVLRDRWMRYAALALVFAVVGRIICHDMVLLPMLNRIFLFVGLGLSLLAASFLYGRFAGAFIKKEGASL